jgi:sodium-dependent dicarboxylate transporter 2/3/5
MLPVALSVIGLVRERVESQANDLADDLSSVTEASQSLNNLNLSILLGIAYGASIGGIGTLIGTPPNLFLASFAKSHLGYEISFVRWMGVGVPLVLVFLPVTWLLLTRVLFPVRLARIEGGEELIRSGLEALGALTRGERITMMVFGMTCGLWIFRPILAGIQVFGVYPLAGLSDSGIAITAALVLFVWPVDVRERVFAMDWETAVRLPWGLLILFGGGLSLAGAIRANSVGEFIGAQFSMLSGVPTVWIIVGIVTLIVFLTELTSNTATTATMIPILAALAPGLEVSPLLLAVPAAIGASCAFMLPVATPPNAVVFGSGQITIAQMSRAGFGLNLIGIILITALAYWVVIPVLGLAPMPD